MRLMLWSAPEVVAVFDGGGGAGSFGTGVVLRLPAQGFIESTAEAQVDFSAFLSPGAEGAEAMILLCLCHAWEAPEEGQLLVETRFA